MEPKIDFTTHCPNCGHDLFFSSPDHECRDCGFTVEVFPSRVDAFTQFRSYLRDPERIVTDPQRMDTGYWVLSSTRMLLV